MLESNFKIRRENGRVRRVVTQLLVKIWKFMKFSLRVRLTGNKNLCNTKRVRRCLPSAEKDVFEIRECVFIMESIFSQHLFAPFGDSIRRVLNLFYSLCALSLTRTIVTRIVIS